MSQLLTRRPSGMYHEWSKTAKMAFMIAAQEGRRPGQLDIARGMDAALAAEVETLIPDFVRAYIDTLTNSALIEPRVIQIEGRNDTGERFTLDMRITRELLHDLMDLTPRPQEKDEGTDGEPRTEDAPDSPQAPQPSAGLLDADGQPVHLLQSATDGG